MSIFILEDDTIQAAHLEHTIRDICEEHHIQFDFIYTTGKGERIIERIGKCIRTPIYFLDIEIRDEKRKGLEVAQQIRLYDLQGIVVFVTTHSEFAPISYQYFVSALGFIDKASSHDEMRKMLTACMLAYEKVNEQLVPQDDFIVDNTKASVRVPFREVEYIMTSTPHRLELAAGSRVIQFYGRLKDIEEQDERLLRCHQSVIVNTENISAIDVTERKVHLVSGAVVPVSRRLMGRVRKRWQQFIKEG